MLIRYNGTNIHALPYIETDKKKLKSMPLAGSPRDIKWLRPGWNEFPSNIWKMNENDPEIKRMLEEKKIELMNITVVNGKKKEVFGPGDEELHILRIPDGAAMDIVKNTHNRDMLQRWLDEETRSKVKRVIEAQIKPLLPESQSA